MIKVKDEKGLARDPSSKAILRTDPEALVEHRRRRKMIHQLHRESSRVSELEQKLEQQSMEITLLKQMVHQLIDHNK